MRILFLFLCIFITACKPEVSQPEGEILKIQRIITKQGIEVWLAEDNSHPIIAMNFTFKGAGGINETVDTQGTAQLLSNTMDEGAGEYPSQEFQKELNDNSITLRFSSDRDNFGGKLKTLSRHQDKAFELLKLAINAPRFDNEPLMRMKQSNIARIQSNKTNPDWIRARLTNDIIYQGHPYALNSGGTITTLEKISADDLKSYHNKFLTKDRLIISVVGDITPQALASKIDMIFGELPADKTHKERQDFALQNKGITFIYEKDIPQSLITMVLPAIKKNDPDHYALKVMNIIYGGGGFGSRLMEEIREKRGLTYGIYSSISDQDYSNSFRVSSSTKNESAAELIQIVRDEMLKLTQSIDDNEIEKAKSYIIGKLLLSMTSTDKISSLVQNLRLDGRNTDYLDGFADNINAITIEDIKRVTGRILKPDDMTTIIVGQPDNIENFELINELPNVE